MSAGLFAGKNALVTGGTRGIGRAVSLALAEKGARVMALYARDRANAEALEQEAKKRGLEITTWRGDLSDEEILGKDLEEIRRWAPQVHFVVHSAASGVHRKAMDLTPRHMKWTFDINVFAIHNLLRGLVESIPAGGRIIGITSSGGERTIPFYAAVGASKGALESLMRHYAQEFAPKGIAVNCICPGMVETDAIEAFPDKEQRLQVTLDRTPTGKLTRPEEVAALAVFLCSEASAQIIGQTIVMDGGKTLSA